MKKLFFSLVAAIVAATATFAQSSMLATLSHEGEISTYYGATALRDAYNAAANGDVITLSSGSFNAVDIKKGLTIRGAGMGTDTSMSTEPSVLVGSFTIDIADTVSSRLTIEGVYNNQNITMDRLKDAMFLKNRFWVLNYNSSSIITNLTIIHCRIVSTLYCPPNSSMSFLNSVIGGPVCVSAKTSNLDFTNCIIHKDNIGNIYYSSFKNCILVGNTSRDNWMNSTNTAYNCLNVDDLNSTIFRNILTYTNAQDSYSKVFTSYRGGYFVDIEKFELTDEAKEKYIGMDGTQVGIYGGNLPFSSTPTNPQITKCNVAAKSTADGKLSVDITVNGAE